MFELAASLASFCVNRNITISVSFRSPRGIPGLLKETGRTGKESEKRTESRKSPRGDATTRHLRLALALLNSRETDARAARSETERILLAGKDSTRPLRHGLQDDRETGSRGASRKSERTSGGRGTTNPRKDTTPRRRRRLHRRETERREPAAARRRERPRPRVLQTATEPETETPPRRGESLRPINKEREPAPTTRLSHPRAPRPDPTESRRRRSE